MATVATGSAHTTESADAARNRRIRRRDTRCSSRARATGTASATKTPYREQTGIATIAAGAADSCHGRCRTAGAAIAAVAEEKPAGSAVATRAACCQ